jgi:hypothetical protein
MYNPNDTPSVTFGIFSKQQEQWREEEMEEDESRQNIGVNRSILQDRRPQ